MESSSSSILNPKTLFYHRMYFTMFSKDRENSDRVSLKRFRAALQEELGFFASAGVLAEFLDVEKKAKSVVSWAKPSAWLVWLVVGTFGVCKTHRICPIGLQNNYWLLVIECHRYLWLLGPAFGMFSVTSIAFDAWMITKRWYQPPKMVISTYETQQHPPHTIYLCISHNEQMFVNYTYSHGLLHSWKTLLSPELASQLVFVKVVKICGPWHAVVREQKVVSFKRVAKVE